MDYLIRRFFKLPITNGIKTSVSANLKLEPKKSPCGTLDSIYSSNLLILVFVFCYLIVDSVHLELPNIMGAIHLHHTLKQLQVGKLFQV